MSLKIEKNDEWRGLKESENLRIQKEMKIEQDRFNKGLDKRVLLTNKDAQSIEGEQKNKRIVDLVEKEKNCRLEIFELLLKHKKQLSIEVRNLLRLRSELSEEALNQTYQEI